MFRSIVARATLTAATLAAIVAVFATFGRASAAPFSFAADHGMTTPSESSARQTPPSSQRSAMVYPTWPFEPAIVQSCRWPPGQLAYVASSGNRSGAAIDPSTVSVAVAV